MLGFICFILILFIVGTVNGFKLMPSNKAKKDTDLPLYTQLVYACESGIVPPDLRTLDGKFIEVKGLDDQEALKSMVIYLNEDHMKYDKAKRVNSI